MMEYMFLMVALALPSRVEMFRLLGDEDRLRLLALCSEDELTVGELAQLLSEAQPQVTKKSQPLRDAGLLRARKDGTRTLLSTHAAVDDTVCQEALREGRALCTRDGSLARVAQVVRAREDHARRFFAHASGDAPAAQSPDALAALLPIIAPLLPGRALAVDVGTGEGPWLPLLSPLYERVIAVDRSAARLARCAARVSALGLPNVRLREGDIDDAGILQDVAARGGADLVLMARVLHHAARPRESLAAASALLKSGGHLLIVDYLPHEDDRMREQGDVWLGFDPLRLRELVTAVGLRVTAAHSLSRSLAVVEEPPLQIVAARKD